MSEIKAIIFDLGGVIINLDIPKTISEFNKLTHASFETIYTQANQVSIFDQFDKGEISEELFFEELNRLFSHQLSFKDMLLAWNAMLLDFPKHRLDLLSKLKSQYRIFLLSNTNETHVSAFEKILFDSHGYENLEPFFEKVYYSCRIGMRKPDEEIFNFVLSQHQLNPTETLFIDDSIQHIQSAKRLGIKSYLLAKNQEPEELLNRLITI
jgi:epoxide hydrolase-like predicted phosphatase